MLAFALSLLGLGPVQVGGQRAAADVIFFLGDQRCTVTLRVEQRVGILEITTPAPGECLGGVTVALSATLKSSPVVTCAGGAAEGPARLALMGRNGTVTGFDNATMRALPSGGAVTLTIMTPVAPDGALHVVGAGHLVQSPSAVEACAAAADVLTWTGTLMLEAALVNGPHILGPPVVPRPEDAIITSLAGSGFERGREPGELFAVGISRGGCFFSEVNCDVLFHSADGGAFWERLPGENLRGDVFVPPGYPDDHVIYTSDAEGLQVSKDGGRSFREVPSTALAGGPPSLSPGFSAGDRRILLGNAPGWEYDAALDVTTPLVVTPPSVATKMWFGFDPEFMQTGRFFMVSNDFFVEGMGTKRKATFHRCSGRFCERTAVFETPFLPAIQVSSALPWDEQIAVFVYCGNRMWWSGDGGETLARVTLPVNGFICSMSDDGRGTFYAALLPRQAGADTGGGVLRSENGGRTWELLGKGTRLERGVHEVLALPDGRVLAALDSFAGGGIYCSVNRGATWAPRCPR